MGDFIWDPPPPWISISYRRLKKFQISSNFDTFVLWSTYILKLNSLFQLKKCTFTIWIWTDNAGDFVGAVQQRGRGIGAFAVHFPSSAQSQKAMAHWVSWGMESYRVKCGTESEVKHREAHELVKHYRRDIHQGINPTIILPPWARES